MERFDLEEKIMVVWSTKEDIALLMRQHMDRAEPMTEDEIANALLGIESLMEMRCQELWDCYVSVFKLDGLSEKDIQISDKTVHKAVLAEREACAKLVEAIERLYSSIPPYRENGECTIPDHVVDFVNSALANAIRARSEK